MPWVPLFIFGAAFGSFINVLALRYDPDRRLLARPAWSGRSRCPHCGKTLRWFELVPILSFLFQGGRCLRCNKRLSLQYPFAEAASGLIFAFVPAQVQALFPALALPQLVLLSALWIAVFASLLLMSLIDLRLKLIPDELQAWLAVLGLALALCSAVLGPSRLAGPYDPMFGPSNVWLNRILAVVISSAFIGLLVLATRGRGMGFGDLKLMFGFGLIFGWPGILLLLFLAFVIGAAWGLLAIRLGAKRLKSAVAFGPFLALAGLIVFFWGGEIMSFYFGLLGF